MLTGVFVLKLEQKMHRNGHMIILNVSNMSYKKQPPRGVPRKSYSEIMQQIYRRTPMPKCDFTKVPLSCKATLLKSHFGMGVLL